MKAIGLHALQKNDDEDEDICEANALLIVPIERGTGPASLHV